MLYSDLCEYTETKCQSILDITLKEIRTDFNIILIESKIQKIELIYLNFGNEMQNIINFYKNFA